MRGLFSNGEKLELYKPEVGELKGLDGNFFLNFCEPCSMSLMFNFSLNKVMNIWVWLVPINIYGNLNSNFI